MKLLNSKPMIRFSATALSLAFGLLFAASAAISADRWSEPEQTEGFVDTIEGTFDGLDLKTKNIWISDMIYRIDRGIKVKGTAKKLGLITDLRQGELIKATLRENEKVPEIPYVILIERQ